MGVEAGQQQLLAGDRSRGEPGHLVPGEVVPAAVDVQLTEQALPTALAWAEERKSTHSCTAGVAGLSAHWVTSTSPST